ncbi:hypothetical protein L2E82_05327 [Cichorium intybus]|uniref:Uncharacterized protein n=1 Tax=Cichorium intybus TaxID=13427 RepID=A0ACB9H870_CICIN|nr:hypothetical protein L2E82_05327 [Cichorium intybus]
MTISVLPQLNSTKLLIHGFPANRKAMGLVKVAVGDGVLTFLWVFCVSCLGIGTSIIAKATGIQGIATLLITISLVFILLFFFGIIGAVLGGASFNPTGTAAFYAVGHGGDTLISAAVRLPAQAVGAVGGAVTIVNFMPLEYKHMLGSGPYLKVDVHTGAIVEGMLTFMSSIIVLYVILRGPKSWLMKNWLLSASIVTLVGFGRSYTGPSMNPANAFGWAYVHNRLTWKHLYVYWISPFIGAISAGWTFRFIFPPPSKQKVA